ncbi:MAG: YfhO family protein [Saccharofermentanales bacterium]
MQLIGSKLRKYLPYALPPVIAVFLTSLIYQSAGMYPFGDKSLAWADMKQQVIPLMIQWREIVFGEQSLFFTMTNGGGTNFWGIFFFFVSSPFSLLILFVDKSDSILFMNILVAGKLAFAAFTSGLMFHKILSNLSRYFVCFLSIVYTFCGFSLMFYQNLVWLDFVCLFPLLVFGLFRMLRNEKYGVYAFSLTAMLMTNYYMSYMAVLFIVLFAFTYMVFTTDGKKFASMLIFSSLFSGLATSYIWLPALMQYFESARTVSIFQSLSNGGMITYFETTSAILFSSGILLTISALAIVNAGLRKVPLRLLFLYFLMTIPVFIEPVNKLWHTGSYQAFPARYGYITVMLGLIIIGYYFSQNDKQDNPQLDERHKTPISNLVNNIILLISVAVTAAACLISVYLLENRTTDMASYSRTLWGDETSIKYIAGIFFGFGICYTLLIMFRHFKRLSDNLFKILFATLLAVEIFLNGGIYIAAPARQADYYDNIFDLENRIDDESIYRVKTKLKYFDVNLMGAIGYNNLSTYTSLTSQQFLFTMKKLGFSSYWMEVNSSHGTAFSDALMSNKYEVSQSYDKGLFDETNIYSNTEYAIRQKKYYLESAFILGQNSLESLSQIPMDNRFDIQNKLFKALTGNDTDLFHPYMPTYSENVEYRDSDKTIVQKPDYNSPAFLEYDIHVSGKQILYFDLFDNLSAQLVEHVNDSCRIYVDSTMIQDSYPSKYSNGILELGSFEDTDVSIKIEILKNIDAISFGVSGMDYSLFSNEIEKLQQYSKISSITQKGNRFYIEAVPPASANENQYVVLTIPSYRNTNIMVNGVSATPLPFLDSFIAIPIGNGVQQIKISFVPDGFIPGMIISVFVVMLTLFLYIYIRKAAQKKMSIIDYLLPNAFNQVTRYLFLIFGAAILAGLYIFPIVYYLVKH